MTRPQGLTPEAYRFALQSQLERLIVAAGDDALWILKIVERNEPDLSLHGTPAQIAETMVDNSSWLCERARMPVAHPDDDQVPSLWPDGEDTLESFLSELYYDGGGD